jgi:hypothetical protein
MAMSDVALTVPRPGRRARLAALAPQGSWQRSTLREIRATVLAGIWLGALVGGIGGRLAMLVLRLLSPPTVHGVTSDHGFFIGRVTLAGTSSLIAVCAVVGLIGAVAYRWVDSWLLGPRWFRQLTSAVGAGAVVGSMLVQKGGVDFRLLRPLPLAVALFIFIPAVFGFFIGPLERTLARPDAWVNRGRRGWILPLVTVVVIPPMIIVVLFLSAFMGLWGAARQTRDYASIHANRLVGLIVRAVWAGIALLGLVTLVSDASTILG